MRNPNIADMFQRIEYIEKMGTGINKIKNSLKEANLPEPQFEFTSFFTIKFQRPTKDVSDKGIEKGVGRLGVKLGVNETKILEMILDKRHITAEELSKYIGISKTAIENNIAKLKKKRLLKRVGPDKGGHWEALK